MPDRLKKSLINAGPSEEAVRDLLNKPKRPETIYPPIALGIGEDLPMPDHAPMFRKDAFPFVVGDQKTAKAVDSLLQLAPELRGTFKEVGYGPSKYVVNRLLQSHMSPYDYENSNLFGTTNTKDRKITLNPRLSWRGNEKELSETLIHEMTHAKGYEDDKATEMEKLVPKDLIKKTKKQDK